MSNVFSEKEIVTSNDGFARFEFKNLAKGESVIVYLADITKAESDEFGEFSLFKMLRLGEGETLEQMLEGSELISSIPNTQLSNMLDEGVLVKGNLYRIEKAWERGDSFAGGKKAKGFGYKVFTLSNPNAMPQIIAKYRELRGAVVESDGEQVVTKKAAGKPTL